MREGSPCRPDPDPAPTIDNVQNQQQSLLYRGVVLAQRPIWPFPGKKGRGIGVAEPRRMLAFERNHPVPQKGSKLCRTRNRDCFGETVGKMWQRFSTSLVCLKAVCRTAAGFIVVSRLTCALSMNYRFLARSVLAPSPKPLAG